MEKTVIHPRSFGFSRKGRVSDPPQWEFRTLANLVRQNVSLVDMIGLILFFPLSPWKPSSLRKVSVILTHLSQIMPLGWKIIFYWTTGSNIH
jgi:hypothetical protein